MSRLIILPLILLSLIICSLGSIAGADSPLYVEPSEAVLGDTIDAVEPAYSSESSWFWFRWLYEGLRWTIVKLHDFTGNWPLAIIVLALSIQVLMLPLSKVSNRHQIRMNLIKEGLKEELAAIKKQYKNNAEERDEAIFALYKKHGLTTINQLKGILPLLIQLPILVALFRVMLNLNEMEGASFLWINDLTQVDALFSWGLNIPWLGSSFNLLPLILFGEQCLMGWYSAQKKWSSHLFIFPAVVALMFYPFPSGVMLYFAVGTSVQVVQLAYQGKRVESVLPNSAK